LEGLSIIYIFLFIFQSAVQTGKDFLEDAHIVNKEIINCIKKLTSIQTLPISTVIAKIGVNFVNHHEKISIIRKQKGDINKAILSFSLIGVNKNINPLNANITPMLTI
tara:strand:- start:207 stop:530 length:324 start_codon:yes stop_codon:yes gene_type:complete